MPYNCLYLNKGNNSSVNRSILTKLIGYQEFIILIICTNNELNLTNRYWDMVPDRQKVRIDGRTEWTDGQTDGRTDDAKTISLRLRRGIIKTLSYCKMVWRVFEITVALNFNFRPLLCSCEDVKFSNICINMFESINRLTCKCGLRNTD